MGRQQLQLPKVQVWRTAIKREFREQYELPAVNIWQGTRRGGKLEIVSGGFRAK